MGMDKTVFAKKIMLPLNREKYFIFFIVLYPVVLFEVKEISNAKSIIIWFMWIKVFRNNIS